MSFRRDGRRERAHAEWVRANREVLLRTGIPLAAWDSWVSWENFLFCDLGYQADPSGFQVEDLSDSQAETLCLFLEEEERRGRPGATVLVQLQRRLGRAAFAPGAG